MACTSWACSPSANRPAVNTPASIASVWPSSSRERPSAVSASACRLMVRVGQSRHGGERLEGGGDHAAVQAERAGPVHQAVVDEVPATGQRRQCGDQSVYPVLQQIVGGVAQLLTVEPAPQFGDRAVRPLPLLDEGGQVGGAGELHDRQPAFALQLGDHGLAGAAQVVQQGARGEQVQGGTEGQRRREDPQRQERGHRCDDQRGQLGADRPVAGSHQTSPVRGGRRGAGTAGQRARRLRARPSGRAPARAPWAGYVIARRCTTARRADLDAPDMHLPAALADRPLRPNLESLNFWFRIRQESASDRDWRSVRGGNTR